MQVQSGKGYNLNVSLFERLVQERLQYTSLRTQHRMRPEISQPVRQLMYGYLKDHVRTHGRSPILGVGSSVPSISGPLARTKNSAFLVAHAWPEQADNSAGVAALDSKSRVNGLEAAMVVKVLKYILQQGYGGGEVVVLTPYLGQLRVLRECMRRDRIQDVADERDEADLERQGLEMQVRSSRHCNGSSCVCKAALARANGLDHPGHASCRGCQLHSSSATAVHAPPFLVVGIHVCSRVQRFCLLVRGK